jgi:hypothetical protein
MQQTDSPFWKTTPLDQMSAQQWESLCDGCGRCCLIKLEDEDTGEIAFTNVACRLLDLRRCRCRHYPRRHELVPDCLVLRPLRPAVLRSLPSSCAYRLLAEGRELPWWHPLVSGDPATVREAGVSVAGGVVSEKFVHPDELHEHVIDWVT